jgi:hypothetical protein|tara:strand:- start:130 stop:399 length:270 start_codon:yes stop_codon:yes gene_type:complete
MSNIKSYVKFASKYALKMGMILFLITFSVVAVKVMIIGSNDPTSVVLKRLGISALAMFAFFYIGSFIHGLYKYYIESPFQKVTDGDDAS